MRHWAILPAGGLFSPLGGPSGSRYEARTLRRVEERAGFFRTTCGSVVNLSLRGAKLRAES